MDKIDNALSSTQDCTCLAYRRASRAVTRHYESKFRGSELRATQFTILSVLAQSEPMPVSKIASLIGLERTTLTRNIAPLVERGFVVLSGSDDQRVRLVEITPAGKAEVLAKLPLWRSAQDSVGAVIAKLHPIKILNHPRTDQ